MTTDSADADVSPDEQAVTAEAAERMIASSQIPRSEFPRIGRMISMAVDMLGEMGPLARREAAAWVLAHTMMMEDEDPIRPRPDLTQQNVMRDVQRRLDIIMSEFEAFQGRQETRQ